LWDAKFLYDYLRIDYTNAQLAKYLNKLDMPGYESVDWRNVKLYNVSWEKIDTKKEAKRITAESKNASAVGGIIGGAVGGLLFILILVVIWRCIVSKKRRQQNDGPTVTNITIEQKAPEPPT